MQRVVSVAVEVAEPQVGLIRDVRQFTGTLRARSQVDIAPRISGRVNRLLVDIGDVVAHGQVIARLDDEEHLQEVEQARADLLVAEATLQERQSTAGIAQRDFERAQRLREQRIASESELDAAQSRYQSEQAAVRVAEAEVSRRQAALRAAQVRLSYCTIAANWEDHEDAPSMASTHRIVGERFIDEGATIAANAPLVSLLDIDRITAVLFVTERDYGSLRRGLIAIIESAPNPERLYEGTIVRMAPAFQEGSRQARVEIEIDNEDHTLKPGMFVAVSLELGRDTNALTIPRQALIQRESVQGVFVVNGDNTATFVPVRLGIRDRTRVQVLDPVLENPVVVLGQHLLSDGMPVSVSRDDEP